MNNNQLTVLHDLIAHSKKYDKASISMIKTNIEFITSYNSITLTQSEKQEILDTFLNESELEIV